MIKVIISFLCALISFLVVWIFAPWLIRYLKKINLVVKDQNKEKRPLIPLSGGIIVMGGMFIGLLMYVFFKIFFFELTSDKYYLTYLFAAISSMMMITFVGFIDDLIIKRNHNDSSGLKQWQKPLLTLVAAIPLIVINAGTTTMAIPFLGKINFGLIYPLVLIPIGVVGAANMVNLLAGFNGLETGMGIVYTGMLGLYAYANGIYISALIALMAFSALLAFYYYNKYPAKIFPGDSLTYLLGATLACIAILGNMEKAVLIVAVPFFIEFILKARGKFKKQSYGYYKDEKVCNLYGKEVYSIPHLLTRTCKYSEKQVTYFCIFIEFVFASLIWLV